MVYEIFVCLQNIITVKDAILESIKSYNEKFISEEIPLLLKEDENCFELYLSKKNGCAKKDLPCNLFKFLHLIFLYLALDFFQILSMTHIKTFTLSEKSDEGIFDLRKSSKTASTNSHDSKVDNETIINKSQSIVIANHSYVNSLLNLKGSSDKEEGIFDDCQKHMFCGVWKLFSKKKDIKKIVTCQS